MKGALHVNGHQKPRTGLGRNWTEVLAACRTIVERYIERHRRVPHGQQMVDEAEAAGIAKAQAKRAWRVLKKEYR
jgi:hypothetical protein